MAAPTYTLPTTGVSPKTVTKAAHEAAIDAVAQSLYTEISAIATGLAAAGAWDASSGSFPSGATRGTYYIVDTAGTVDSQAFAVGDWLIPLVTNASTSTFVANWTRGDYSKVVPPGLPPSTFKTATTLLADTTLAYSPGAGDVGVATGDIIDAGPFRYEVAASGATDHHVTTAGGVKLYVLSGDDGSVGVDQFDGDLKAAIEFGGVVDLRGKTISLSSKISATVSRDTTLKNGKVEYTGSHDEYAVRINDATGLDLVIDKVTFDGKKNVNKAVEVLNNTSNTTPTTFTTHGMVVENVKRLNSFLGGDGVLVRGAFDAVTFNGGRVENCELPTGQGTVGVIGISGITGTFYSTTSYIRSLTLNGTVIEKVYSSDGTYTDDQDGLKYFTPSMAAGGRVPSDCVITGGAQFRNCYGRSIKTQCRHTHVHPGTRFHRDEGLTGGAGNGEINAQSGSSTIKGASFNYENGQEPTYCVLQSPDTATGARAGASVEGCEVFLDSSTTLFAFFHTFPSSNSDDPFTTMRVVGNRINGTVERFLEMTTNSVKNLLTCEDNWVEEISDGPTTEKCLIYIKTSGTAPPYYAYVHANRNVYFGSATAYLARARVAGTSMDASISAMGNFGFVDDIQEQSNDLDPLKSHAIRASIQSLNAGTTDDRNTGKFFSYCKAIVNGTTETFPFQEANGSFIIMMTSLGAQTHALFAASNGGLNEVASGTSVTVGNTTNPATAGDFNVWRSATGEVSVENDTASTRLVTLWVFAPR